MIELICNPIPGAMYNITQDMIKKGVLLFHDGLVIPDSVRQIFLKAKKGGSLPAIIEQ
jgi:hypothetical protein